MSRDSWLARRGLVYWVSAEWMLETKSNGGGVIVARSAWIALLLYFPALILWSWADSKWSTQFDIGALGKAVSETVPWLGAIFAAVYAALYTRFASQWQYLAGVFNQLMAAQSQIEGTGVDPNRLSKIRLWKAAFAEDAEDLHLAGKRVFRGAVMVCLRDPGVAAMFDEHTVGGENRRLKLLAELERRELNRRP